jgi:hypothetical protein
LSNVDKFSVGGDENTYPIVNPAGSGEDLAVERPGRIVHPAPMESICNVSPEHRPAAVAVIARMLTHLNEMTYAAGADVKLPHLLAFLFGGYAVPAKRLPNNRKANAGDVT